MSCYEWERGNPPRSLFVQMQEEGCPECLSEDTYICQAECLRGSEIVRGSACVCNDCGWAVMED